MSKPPTHRTIAGLVALSSFFVAAFGQQSYPSHPSTLEMSLARSRFPKSVRGIERMSGQNLQALLVVAQAMKQMPGLTHSQREISHYTFYESQDDSFLYVYLIPLEAVGEPLAMGGENSIGREALFTIKKRGYKIVRKVWYE